MKIEVLSKESNATNWIVASYRRNKTNDKTHEETCEEIAKELGFDFELKENEVYSFKDKQ